MALNATLGLQPAISQMPVELPALWHWLYFRHTATRSRLAEDGHPLDDDVKKLGARPRRMFAAARVNIEKPLRLGAAAQLREVIVGRRDKIGRSGPLHIVTFEHQYRQDGVLCIVEQRDIVYRTQADTGVTMPPTTSPIQLLETLPNSKETRWQLHIRPDPIMLMRFSSLTFNAHRIHYDQAYAQQVEGYPERLVQGPLVAILLAELVRMNDDRPIRRFDFRARGPLFVNDALLLTGEPTDTQVELRASGSNGHPAMEACAWLAT